MNIKEVEDRTEISKANIRYYEQQGLLEPARNEKNNYRDYGIRDIEILNKIKLLRFLEISLQDIKNLQKERITVSELMQNRIKKLEAEQEQLEEIHRICEMMKTRAKTFSDMDMSLIDWNSCFFKMRGESAMKMERINRIYTLMNNIRNLMCAATILFPIIIFGRVVLGNKLSDTILIANFVIILILLGIWAYFGHQLTAYRSDTKQ